MVASPRDLIPLISPDTNADFGREVEICFSEELSTFLLEFLMRGPTLATVVIGCITRWFELSQKAIRNNTHQKNFLIVHHNELRQSYDSSATEWHLWRCSDVTDGRERADHHHSASM